MSMNGNFKALSDRELDTLAADPSRVEELLFASLLGGSSNGHEELEIDKAWHGLGRELPAQLHRRRRRRGRRRPRLWAGARPAQRARDEGRCCARAAHER